MKFVRKNRLRTHKKLDPRVPDHQLSCFLSTEHKTNPSKMKTAILVALGLVVIAACAQALMSPWHTWKRQHGKTYENKHEEESRRKIFMNNLHKINEHNALYEQGLKTYTVGLNKFADMVSLLCLMRPKLTFPLTNDFF